MPDPLEYKSTADSNDVYTSGFLSMHMYISVLQTCIESTKQQRSSVSTEKRSKKGVRSMIN